MIPLEPNKHYHIYNHANGFESLFIEDENYRFFLRKYKQYILPIADTLAYCLMQNHFHLFIKIKDENIIDTPSSKISTFLSRQFSNLFSSYTQAFNKKYRRKGSLMYKNFKRKEVKSDDYAIRLINYIHFNPVKDHLSSDIDKWQYSSFNAINQQGNTLIDTHTVLELFGGIDNFRYMHQKAMNHDFDY